MNEDIFNTINELVGEDGHVMYVPHADEEGAPEDAPAYQIDGSILGITEDAIEGQYVLVFEDEQPEDKWGESDPAGFRAVPLGWVVGASAKTVQ